MAYKVSYRTSFERDLKAFKKNKPMKNQVRDIVTEIIENPTLGIPYSANLSGLIKHSFHQRPQMRIIFAQYDCCNVDINNPDNCNFDDVDGLDENEECQGLIEFIFVKTREQCNNLYRQNRAYFENYLRTLDDDETSE